MLKNRIWFGIILSIILLLFSIPGFTFYNYTQQSGVDYFVGTGDKSDALEDTIEVREILDAYGNLLGHSQYNTTYPKVDGTTIGTLQIPEAGLKFSNAPVNGDIAAYIAGEMTWQTKAELGLDLSLYYLKTAIDSQGEVETIWGVTLATDTELTALKFTDLTDTPAAYTGQAGLYVKVNAGETALEFGAGGGGASELSDLSDVGITNPTDKYVLVADGDSFESRAISSDDLSDVASIAMLNENETITGLWSLTDYLYIKRASDSVAAGPELFFERKRDGDPTIDVSSGDQLGEITFNGYHTFYEVEGASIRVYVDGTPAEYDMPGRIEFLTTPDGDWQPDLRMAIDNAGNIKMGDGAWTNYVNVTAGGAMTAEGTASIKATDLVIASQASGDILYFNGTNWIRLAKGTAGQILTMNAGGTAPEWQTP